MFPPRARDHGRYGLAVGKALTYNMGSLRQPRRLTGQRHGPGVHGRKQEKS